MSDDSAPYSVRATVFSIIAKETGIDESKVSLDSTLKELGIPSLDAVQVIFEIEDHYGIQIPERDPDFDIESVKGLVDTVEKLLAEKAANPDSSAPPPAPPAG
jgi:acyl carrier protein